MKKLLLLLLLVCISCADSSSSTASGLIHVQRVIDGSTLVMNRQLEGASDRATLLGIQVPSEIENKKFAKKARDFTNQWLQNKEAFILFINEKDEPKRFDSYGQALVWVHYAKHCLNIDLVKNGLATVNFGPYKFLRHKNALVRAQWEAKANRRGLFKDFIFPDYEFEIELMPSFISHARMKILKVAGLSRIEIEFTEEKTYKHINRKISLPDWASYGFVTGLQKALGKKEAPQTKGRDGINVAGSFKSDIDKKIIFKFWSPKKSKQLSSHSIAECFFSAIDHAEYDDDVVKYFEALFDYFEFGMPLKSYGGDPYRIKIFGSLSYKHKKELNDYFLSLPNIPLEVDMSHFRKMHLLIQPVFKTFIQTHDVTFIVNKAAKHELLNIAAEEKIIFRSASKSK